MQKDSKLYHYLQTCSGYELRRFRVFLESPYFNQRQDVLKAWDCIRPHFFETDSPPPSEQEIFEAAYPDQAFQDGKYRHLISEICTRLERFWQVQQLERQQGTQSKALLEVLAARGLHREFDSMMAEAQTALLAQPSRDRDYLRHRFDLALLLHDHQVQRSNRGIQSGLLGALEAMDEEYFTNKLRLAAAAINRALVLGETIDVLLLKEVLETIDYLPEVVFEGGLVECYRLVMRFLQSQHDHEAFRTLLDLLPRIQNQCQQDTLAELYSFAMNYCVRMVNLAEPGFDAHLFSLYQICLEKGFLLEGGHLPVPHYKNYMTMGLRLGHAHAIAVEVDRLALLLPDEFRENAIVFSKAALAFHHGDFKTCLKLLQKIEFVDVYYHLDAKSLLLKAYFEQGEIEPILSLIDSFKIYLRRSRKISDYQRQTYRNQIRIVQMLVRHRLGSKTSLGEIQATLVNLRPIADLAWLERKVQEAE